MGRGRQRAGRLVLAAAGAIAARAAMRTLRASAAAPALARVNHRGHGVSLAAGPALAAAGAATAAAGAAGVATGAAALIAGAGAGAVGLYDDIVGARPDQHRDKGFRGHLAALREGRVSSGVVKIAGIGAAGLAAATLLDAGQRRAGRRRGVVGTLLGAGLVAGTANLVNLLDLRPGRALKAGLLLAAPLVAGPAGGLVAGPAGAAAGLLEADLAETVMLGDAGANALGALLGLAWAARCGPAGRAVLLAAVAGLTAASERVSFTQVIESTPILREFDALGRRTPPAATAGDPGTPAAR